MKPAQGVVALFVLTAVLATGCGRDEAGAGQQQAPQVLRRGNGGDPGSLDPALAEDEHAFNVLADLYEGLVVAGPDGAIVPGVAEAWQISDDGLSYRFRLRADARWSNGVAVTAEHFVQSIARARAPATTAPLAFLLDPVARVHAADERMLEIELDRPAPQLLAVLAMPIAAPVWPGTEGDGFRDPAQLVTNGAFVLDAWRPGELLRLRRNPAFHARDDVRLDAVEYYPIADPATELTRYRAGELDLTATVPPASLALLEAERPAELRIAPRLAVYYLALDLGTAPLDDSGLRQALSMAIDREALVRVLGRGEQAAYGFVPAGIAGYVPARYGWAGLGTTERVETARRVFAAAGHEPGLAVTLLYDSGDVHERVALAVAAMWKESLGVETRLEKREWKYFLDSRERRDEWDVMRFAWTGDYAHPGTFLDLFMSKSPMNLPGYRRVEYDELVQAGEFAAAEALMLGDYPVIPLYFYVGKHLVSPGVRGFEPNSLDLHPSRFLSLR